MNINVKGINVNYIEYGQGSTVILLHGWGQNIEMMKFIGDGLAHKHHVVILDLPGFGKSEEPKSPWHLEDYSDMLKEFIDKLNLGNVSLIGHSFGGKISSIYAATNKVEKLILLSAPLIKKSNDKSLKRRIIKTLGKIKGLDALKEKMKKKIGSTDYKNASGIMREVLINNVNNDLIRYAKEIKCPTIFIGGDNDRMVPLWEVEKIEDAIDNCGIIIYEDRGHYAYLDELYRTISIINNFLN